MGAIATIPKARPSPYLRNEHALKLALMIHLLFEKAANKDEPLLSAHLLEDFSSSYSRGEPLNFSRAFNATVTTYFFLLFSRVRSEVNIKLHRIFVIQLFILQKKEVQYGLQNLI